MAARLEDRNGVVVVYRLSWVAALAGLGLALIRLDRLLRPTFEGLPWWFVIVASAILGGSITWAGLSYRLSVRTVAIVNLTGMFLALVRITVPSTTWGIFPTASSFGELGTELAYARDVIRTGVAPVIPLAGIVAIVALVFWAAAALMVWGLLRSHPYVSVLTPLVLYLQFATMDRRPGGWWSWLLLSVLGFALLSVAFDRRRESTGLLTSRVTRTAVVRTLPAVALGLLAALFTGSLWTTNALADLVPRSGVLEWRATSGLTGEYYGSVSYNPFVGIRQSLVSQTGVPVFVASVEGELPGDDVYWRLLTLESFNGQRWFADDPQIGRPEDLNSFEHQSQQFAGPTAEATQTVTILALQMDWLPAVYAPVSMQAENRAVDRGFRVKEDDGSLHFDALSYRGMTYRVVSEVPMPDLQMLSRDQEGELSAIFAEATEEGDFAPQGVTEQPELRELRGAARYLDLPVGIDPEVASLARERTRGLTTDFERALALEAFFRTDGLFRYSTDIEPGHAARDLAKWLLEPTSPNYRTGYCEQFSTSMAVMARLLGIPSRVVLGFTPGRTLSDGRVVVRDSNAHAWVELWLPSQGWVRFDPTPRGDGSNPATTGDLGFDVAPYLAIPEPQTPTFDPGDPTLVEPFLDEEDLGEIPPIGSPEFIDPGAGGAGITLPPWVFAAVLGALVVFGFTPAAKWMRRRRRLRRLAAGSIAAAWAEAVDRLTDLGIGPAAAHTPREFAAATDGAMVPLASIYGRSVYGPAEGVVDDTVIRRAAESLQETEDHLTTRFSPARRIFAVYRPGTLVPAWWRRLRRRPR